MPTKTVDAIYEHGIVRPRRRLPFRDHARLKLTITIPESPVARTRGAIQISPRTARAIIYSPESDFFGA